MPSPWKCQTLSASVLFFWDLKDNNKNHNSPRWMKLSGVRLALNQQMFLFAGQVEQMFMHSLWIPDWCSTQYHLRGTVHALGTKPWRGPCSSWESLRPRTFWSWAVVSWGHVALKYAGRWVNCMWSSYSGQEELCQESGQTWAPLGLPEAWNVVHSIEMSFLDSLPVRRASSWAAPILWIRWRPYATQVRTHQEEQLIRAVEEKIRPFQLLLYTSFILGLR